MFIVIIPYCGPVVRQVNYRFNAGGPNVAMLVVSLLIRKNEY